MRKYGVIYPSIIGISFAEHETLDKAKEHAKKLCETTGRKIDVIEFITSFIPVGTEIEYRSMKLKENGE